RGGRQPGAERRPDSGSLPGGRDGGHPPFPPGRTGGADPRRRHAMTTATIDGTAELSKAYLTAVLGGDRREAFRLVDRACEAGTELSRLYLEVFQPAMREIGRLWQENAITVADEHVATAITQAAMTRAFG